MKKLKKGQMLYYLYGDIHLLPVDDYAILRLTSNCPIDRVKIVANEIREIVKDNPDVKYCPERNSIIHPPIYEVGKL